MDDLPGLFAKDFGFKPHSISTSMASNRSKSSRNSTSSANPVLDDQKTTEFGGLGGYDDVFGAPPKYKNSSNGRSSTSSAPFESVFQGANDYSVNSSTLPVYDKPVYDNEDMFDGVPGLTTSSSVKFENVFSSAPRESSPFDDILGNLGRMEPELRSSDSSRKKWGEVDQNLSGFDDLLPGFGGSSPLKNRATPGTDQPQQSSVPSTISTSSVVEDPLGVLQSASVPAYASSRLFTEPWEQIDKPRQSRSKKVDVSSVQGEIFDDIDPFVSIAKSKPKPLFSSGVSNREPTGEPSIRIYDNVSQKKVPVDNIRASHQSFFDKPTVSTDLHQAFTQNGSHSNTSSTETDSHMGMSQISEDNSEATDDVWLTISEITLTTLPTSAPPPSRPPPPRPPQVLKEVKGSSSVKSKKGKEFSSFYDSIQSNWSPRTVPEAVKRSGVSSIDELENFGMGSPQNNAVEHGDAISNEEDAEKSAAAASADAMKEAMDRAEAKFRHAREARERENAAKNSGAQRERYEKVMQDVQERDLREKLDREQDQREIDEKDRELRKIEKEREQAREVVREKEKGRQAVDRATKEARERATTEARQKADRAAVDKVNAGARERARERAVTEAKERAATEAKERAEKAASEAKERRNTEHNHNERVAVAKAEAEARLRADRASVNRATAEARERAAAAAAAAAAARENQQKNDNDIDSIFNASARPENTSRPKASSSDSGTRKASSTVDDLSIFGAIPSSGDFQEIGGESEDRRRARLERHQRTHERTEKALAEKNERDRHTQWEQAERLRMAESLDFEIKRWSTGKEGNLRALLSTLQYVLWPECGWQPVSLTDLITSASVKKVYRKATLCIHPDKVQQKGASLQQKYIAEKVFDLLKEAWNKLNSEELY